MMPILNHPIFNNTAYSALSPHLITANISSYTVLASYSKGAHALPDIYTSALGYHAYISCKARVPVL